MADTYSTDSDLIKFRPKILSLGIDDFSELRTEAYNQVNRIIELRWYRQVAAEFGFDYRNTQFTPGSVKDGELTNLECFKLLELIYMNLKKDTQEPDGFARHEENFRKNFQEELDLVLATGIDYDWSGNDTFDDDEISVEAPRRQHRV